MPIDRTRRPIASSPGSLPSTAALIEIAHIERLLSGAESGPVGEEALAERERLWARAHDTTGRQCDLPFGIPDDRDAG